MRFMLTALLLVERGMKAFVSECGGLRREAIHQFRQNLANLSIIGRLKGDVSSAASAGPTCLETATNARKVPTAYHQRISS